MPSGPRNIRNIPHIVHADREVVDARSYHWENRQREPKGTIVVQRTRSGTGILHEKGQRLRVQAGQAMIFRYGEPTAYEAESAYELEYVVLSPAGGIGELISQLVQDFGSVVTMAEQGEAARILHGLYRQFDIHETRDQLMMAETAYRLVLSIYREQVALSEGRDPVAYLRHLLQSQFRSPRNLKEWTGGLSMSREHLTRQFHLRYGETPAAFLRRLRLDHARFLARTSSMAVEDIGAACGFGSVQTMRRAFDREFGSTIGRERELHRQKSSEKSTGW